MLDLQRLDLRSLAEAVEDPSSRICVRSGLRSMTPAWNIGRLSGWQVMD